MFMFAAKWALGIDFDKKKVDIAFFTGMPLFVLVILQLYRSQRTQQATNIKEFLSEFGKNQALYSAYFDLVYSFDNELFKKVKEIAEQVVVKLKESNPGKTWVEIVAFVRPNFLCLNVLQDSRKRGSRLYWPRLFAFSPEEKRLDTLLDYFNAVGFYQQEGLVHIRDIARILGDYLAVLDGRYIVQEYLNYCAEWNSSEASGAPEPYPYLLILFEEFKRFNKKSRAQGEIKKLKAKIKEHKERMRSQ